MNKTAAQIAESVLEKIGLAAKPSLSSYWASKFPSPKPAVSPGMLGGFTHTGKGIKPLLNTRKNLLDTARLGISQVGPR